MRFCLPRFFHEITRSKANPSVVISVYVTLYAYASPSLGINGPMKSRHNFVYYFIESPPSVSGLDNLTFNATSSHAI